MVLLENVEDDRLKPRLKLDLKQEKNGVEKGSKYSLGSLILSVLKKKPMKIEEILEKVHEKGWATKSSKPRTLISQELTKQL